jgi:hypothetical protein
MMMRAASNIRAMTLFFTGNPYLGGQIAGMLARMPGDTVRNS